ncbi:CHAT domain-containing protein [Desulfamplus magnetovallimortis]|nr:CHAT domain-containing tetratricopeptide repeat protein [Desulfamplus magnetovallimortis]
MNATLNISYFELTYFEKLTQDLNEDSVIHSFENIANKIRKHSKITIEMDVFYEWAEFLNELGFHYLIRYDQKRIQNLEIAISCFQKIISICNEKNFSEQWALATNNLGGAYTNRIKGNKADNIEKSIFFYKKALSVWTKENFLEDFISVMINLGGAYLNRVKGKPQNNIETAITYYKEALELCDKKTDLENWLSAMNGIGGAYIERIQGNKLENIEIALSFFEKALKEIDPNDDVFNWAWVMENLGDAYRKRIKGDRSLNFEKAIHCFQRVENTLDKKESPMEWADVMNKLGICHVERINGDSAENKEISISYYQKALEIFRKETIPLKHAKVMSNLGGAFLSRKKGEQHQNLMKAEECFNNAIEVYEKFGMLEDLALTMNNLGGLHIVKNNGHSFDEGINCFKKSLQIWKKDTHLQKWAIIMHNMGGLYNEYCGEDVYSKRLEAIRCFQKVIDNVSLESNPTLYLNASYALGNVLIELSSDNDSFLIKAEQYYDQTINGTTDIYLEISDIHARKKFLKQHRHKYKRIINFYLLHKKYEKALYWIERIRSQSFLEDIVLEYIEPSKKEFKPLTDRYWGICKKIRKLRTEISPNNYQHHLYKALAELVNEKQKLASEIKNINPQYADLINANPLTINHLHELLVKNKSAALEFYCLDELNIVHCLVISSESEKTLGYHHFKIDISESFRRAFLEFNQLFHNEIPPNLKLLENLLHESGKIMGPIWQFLNEIKIKNLYISPHDFFHAIPLHAAHINDSQNYFNDNFHCCYTPSLSLTYKLFKSKPNKGRKILSLFYAPDEKPLKAGKAEFEKITNLYEKNSVIILQNDTAKAENLIKNIEKNKNHLLMLCLICHGELDNDGTSFLVFKDRNLSSLDVKGGLDLTGVPVVVLEACETGKSNEWVKNYEEYQALDSSFLISGARSVISSFYKIDDQGTASIMNKFHEEINKGVMPFNAFYEAQKSNLVINPDLEVSVRGRMKKKTNTTPLKSNHPYYWAFMKYSGTF